MTRKITFWVWDVAAGLGMGWLAGYHWHDNVVGLLVGAGFYLLGRTQSYAIGPKK